MGRLAEFHAKHAEAAWVIQHLLGTCFVWCWRGGPVVRFLGGGSVLLFGGYHGKGIWVARSCWGVYYVWVFFEGGIWRSEAGGRRG